MDNENLPLVNLDYPDAKKRNEPITLNDGSPVYFALADISPAGVLKNANGAKERFKIAAEINPTGVMTCQGKTLEQARRILTEILENN